MTTLARDSRSFLLLILLCFSQTVPAQQRGSTSTAAGVSLERLARMDSVIQNSIDKKELPGAVVLVGRHGQIVWRKAYGARAVDPQREAMTVDTIFDLASLTKIVATTTSVMILIEQGKVRLSDPVVQFIPEMKGGGRDAITIEQLLTHMTGFAPDFDLRERWTGYDEAMQHLYREPLRNPPGTRFVYSDINYIALGEVVRRVSGLTLDDFAKRNIFAPLGMRDTGFRPDPQLKGRIAPTEKRRAQLTYLGDSGADAGAEGEQWLRGQVHDPTSFRMNGVAGHAGLFSTADDLSIYCQMILNDGVYHGVRILSPMGAAAMTRPRAVGDNGSARGLGWDVATTFSTNKGDLFPLGSFGHTGFTGTSMWIDPASDTFVIFLSNRVHPNGKGDVGPLRGKIASIVASSIMDTTTVQARQQSANAATEVLASLARLNANRERAAANSAPVADAQVLTGIDVLERDGFRQLAGMRIGLITNQTGRDRNGRSTVDVLSQAKTVKLVCLFSPEHGFQGLMNDKVSDTKDEKTGLPIYSLYGTNYRPTPEQLKGLDALVFDVQDIGTRYYTNIAVMGEAMEEAAKAKLPFFVLDRPNPIDGVHVEGPMREDDELRRWTHSCSTTDVTKANPDALRRESYHPLPLRHGMTVGELALMFNEQRRLSCDLRVVKMQNWRREMWYDATGLVWINPSPNMRNLTEATVYPGIELLKTTGMSVGRGTDTPFEVFGAPWLDGQRLAVNLNKRQLPGVRFVPIRFTPTVDPFKGQVSSGVNIIVTDRTVFRPVFTGIQIAVALHKLYPDEWRLDCFGFLLANEDTLERLKRGESPEQIEASWTNALERFRRERQHFLLYD
jgi:uncharacterized protein YbbC (DUF1343 family)/CubicO group peptidase (beta-lactamase class C family)